MSQRRKTYKQHHIQKKITLTISTSKEVNMYKKNFCYKWQNSRKKCFSNSDTQVSNITAFRCIESCTLRLCWKFQVLVGTYDLRAKKKTFKHLACDFTRRASTKLWCVGIGVHLLCRYVINVLLLRGTNSLKNSKNKRSKRHNTCRTIVQLWGICLCNK